MERAKSELYIRLRDAGQWKAQFYGHDKIHQHDKSIPKKADLCKSIEYSRTPFEALIPHREEWEQGRPGTTDAICFYTDGSISEGQVGGGVYSVQLDIRKSLRLADQCSVFEVEVHAIKEALTCLGKLSLQAPIKSIYSTNTNSRTIADCRRSLHSLLSAKYGFRVTGIS